MRRNPSDGMRIPGTSIADEGKRRLLLMNKRFLHYFTAWSKTPSRHQAAFSVNNTIFPIAQV
jgi:hypothetical protein